jgi:CO/xanthine dehydrogenase FAD-binding subunit
MRFCRATTVDEALKARSEWGDDSRILAGGTDVMVQFLQGELSPAALIHIEGIASLSTVSDNGRTTLGPLTTHRTIATTLHDRHPALAAASATVGGWQTQVKGTIGGNICNASPAADTVPPLLVGDAQVTLSSLSGARRLPLSDFILDRRTTALTPDELLTSVDLEPVPDNAAEVYLKLGRRSAMEVAVVGMAVRLGFAENGSVGTARVAVCSVGPVPQRVPDAEAALIGSTLEIGALDEAGDALIAAATPIDDARGSAIYRRRTLRGLLERAARHCQEESQR